MLSLVLATGITTAALTTGVASADSHEGECDGPRGGNGEGGAYRELIDHEVEEIDKGVVVTITTDDEDALAHIQERAGEEREGPEGVEREVEYLDNGVQITITAEDEETIEKIQDGPKRGGHKGQRGE